MFSHHLIISRILIDMRLAAVPGYYPSFPVKYSNMYNDYSMVTAGLADPFLPQKKEKSIEESFVDFINFGVLSE